MKILWFTNTPVDYYEHMNGYNGGGWMTSLKKYFDINNDSEIGVCFIQNDELFKIKRQNTIYYPVSLKSNLYSKLKYKFSFGNILHKRYSEVDQQYLEIYLKIIDDFKPTIIHIWGTEKNFGLICKYVNIPVVIHIQGIINPYLNAFFPPGISLQDYILKDGLNPILMSKNRKEIKGWEYIASREKEIFKYCKNFIGRTEWDRILTEIYSPNSNYFNCNEALRSEFYNNMKWKFKVRNKIKIVTTISTPTYKGGDLLLKTAQLLKNELNIDFEWFVYGIDNLFFQERLTGIIAFENNILIRGIASAEKLRDELLECNVFVHPSYIDNSPNSICEAQLLGVPIISCNVGGISSLIENKVSGILVPTNDPYTLASKIKEISNSKSKAESLSVEEIIIASKRHDKENIFRNLISIYNEIIVK